MRIFTFYSWFTMCSPLLRPRDFLWAELSYGQKHSWTKISNTLRSPAIIFYPISQVTKLFGIWTNIREQNFEYIVNVTLRSPKIIFCPISSPISRVTKLFWDMDKHSWTIFRIHRQLHITVNHNYFLPDFKSDFSSYKIILGYGQTFVNKISNISSTSH